MPEIFSILSIKTFADLSSDALIYYTSNLQCFAITLINVVFPQPGGPANRIKFRDLYASTCYLCLFILFLVGVNMLAVFGYLYAYDFYIFPDMISPQILSHANRSLFNLSSVKSSIKLLGSYFLTHCD